MNVQGCVGQIFHRQMRNGDLVDAHVPVLEREARLLRDVSAVVEQSENDERYWLG